MAGLVPAIDAYLLAGKQGVDARHKAGACAHYSSSSCRTGRTGRVARRRGQAEMPKAAAVSRRPRGVRCTKPCCIRNGSMMSSMASRASASAAAMRLDADRPAAVVLRDECEDSAGRRRPGRARRLPAASSARSATLRSIDLVALDCGEVAHPAQQAPGDARRAARAPRDLARAVAVMAKPSTRAPRLTISSSSSAV